MYQNLPEYTPNDTDILVVASPKFKKRIFREVGTNIEIYHTQMPEAFIETKIGKLPAYASSMPDVSVFASSTQETTPGPNAGKPGTGTKRDC